MINPEVLEELKRKAAEEEVTRELGPADDETNPQRFTFHKWVFSTSASVHQGEEMFPTCIC
jgi:hypothetical protein